MQSLLSGVSDNRLVAILFGVNGAMASYIWLRLDKRVELLETARERLSERVGIHETLITNVKESQETIMDATTKLTDAITDLKVAIARLTKT